MPSFFKTYHSVFLLLRNKNYARLLLLLAFFLFQLPSFSQNTIPPIGYWREHLSYLNAQQVIKGDKIYCSTIYNLFSIDANNEVERYSKINGLNDFGVNCIGWDSTSQQLVIVYNNSNIDVLKSGTAHNINDVKLSTVSGNKNIYNCYCSNGFAYLCSGLGIIVVNLNKYEIKDTWIIGSNGSQIATTGITSDGTLFYVATTEGLKTAAVNSANLSNYNSWRNISGTNGLSIGVIKNIVYANAKIVAHKNDSLFILNNSNWSLLYADTDWHITNINASQNKILVSQVNVNAARVIQLNTNGTIEQTIQQKNFIVSPKNALTDNGNIWIADSIKGLSKYNSTFESFVPNGPLGTATGEMLVNNNTLYAAAGSVDNSWNAQLNHNGIYTFNNDVWNNINYQNQPKLDSVFDFITLAVSAVDGSLWAGSYGSGLANINNNQINLFKQNNSSLQTSINSVNSCRVSGLAFDSYNNLWISNYGAPADISVRKPDGSWRSFYIPFTHTQNAVGQIVIDNNNQLWIVSPKGNGVFCYNYGANVDAINDDQWKFFKQGIGNGNLPSNNVFCLAKDKNGFIWIGTDKGIGVVQCTYGVFTQNCEAVLPVVQVDNFAGYLFQDEQVKTIAVDGADRKWVGTLNGVWLLSSDGTNTVYHFTEENSPLLSNDIKRIAIDPQTGEVFIATAKGICSFRSTATEGGTTNSNVLVFPNPVPPNYNGTIAIRGLTDNTLVKICELNGRLVYETRALGGQAVWDGRNYKGQKINSGIYLVLVRNDDGTEKTATKIVYIGSN
jgi:hypothetical protein